MFRFVLLGTLLAGGVGVAANAGNEPLQLIKRTPLPDIKGDFDHFAVDVKGNRLFLTAEEHHSIEVLELSTGKFLRSVGGFDTPHSILFVPEKNRLYVIDGGAGACKVIDGSTFATVSSIPVAKEADAMVYDPASQTLYVAAGGEEAKMDHSILGIISAASGKYLGELKIDSGNIEGMVVEKGGPRLWMNLRDKHQIAVVDRATRTLIATWPLQNVQGNTPMALDEPNHRLFIAGRKPGKFVVLDSNSGKVVSSLPCGDGADDLSYDPAHKRIYVTGSEGLINVYEQRDPNHYQQVAVVKTATRGKNSILVDPLNQFYVAVSQNKQQVAEVLVYKIRN